MGRMFEFKSARDAQGKRRPAVLVDLDDVSAVEVRRSTPDTAGASVTHIKVRTRQGNVIEMAGSHDELIETTLDAFVDALGGAGIAAKPQRLFVVGRGDETRAAIDLDDVSTFQATPTGFEGAMAFRAVAVMKSGSQYHMTMNRGQVDHFVALYTAWRA